MRRLQPEGDAALFDDLVPALDAGERVLDVVIAQLLVERVQRRGLAGDEPPVADFGHRIGRPGQQVIVADLRFVETPFETGRIEGGGVRGDVCAEKIHGHTEVKIEVALDRRQVDQSQRADFRRIVDLVLHHRLAGALDDAAHARFADEHVVRFLGKHEPTGARQRVEARFCERTELVLAVAVGEVGKHEKREPVGRLLVERAEDARIVGIARAPLEQRFGFLAAVAAEVGLQQVDHRPQVAAFLDVDLEEVAKIVKRRAGETEMALLLDRSRLGIALRDDQTPQVRPVFARDFLPRRLAFVCTEIHLAPRFGRCEKDAPAVVRHLHVIEMRPAFGLDADRGAEVNVGGARPLGPHVGPPVLELGLPVLQRALQRQVARKLHVVGDLVAVINVHECSVVAVIPVPN